MSKNWTRENMAWLSGFYEGEGCLYVGIRKDNKGSGKNIYHFDITNTDLDVLKKANFIAGMGKVVNVGRNEPHQKDRLRFRLHKAHHIYALCMAMYPFLGERRKAKIKEFVELFKKLDIQERHGEYPKNQQCSVCGAIKKLSREMCNSCYMRWRRYGDPLKGFKRLKINLKEDMPMIENYKDIDNCKVCNKSLFKNNRSRGMCGTCYMRWSRAKKRGNSKYTLLC